MPADHVRGQALHPLEDRVRAGDAVQGGGGGQDAGLGGGERDTGDLGGQRLAVDDGHAEVAAERDHGPLVGPQVEHRADLALAAGQQPGVVAELDEVAGDVEQRHLGFDDVRDVAGRPAQCLGAEADRQRAEGRVGLDEEDGVLPVVGVRGAEQGRDGGLRRRRRGWR